MTEDLLEQQRPLRIKEEPVRLGVLRVPSVACSLRTLGVREATRVVRAATCLFALVGMMTVVAHAPLGAQRPVCGTRTTAACTAPGLTFQTISAGFAHSCGVTSEGAAYCWGDGRKGALGNGRRQVSRSPQRVAGQYAFVEVGEGGDFTCGRTADSQVL